MNRVVAALLMTGAGLALLPAAANAAPRRHHRVPRAAPANAAPPLTVRPRSYLDPGQIVPVGSLDQYVTVISRPQNDLYESGGLGWRFGVGTLPGPFTAPGRPEPIVEF